MASCFTSCSDSFLFGENTSLFRPYGVSAGHCAKPSLKPSPSPAANISRRPPDRVEYVCDTRELVKMWVDSERLRTAAQPSRRHTARSEEQAVHERASANRQTE